MNDFPQIPEFGAPPEVAAIYDDLRAVSGVPTVNLIWRHFAALPGVLPWAWAAARPVMASAQLAAARQAMAGSVALPPLGPMAAPAAAVAVVDGYVRGNLTNLLTLTALRLWLEGARPPAELTPAQAQPPAAPLGKLPSLSDLPAPLAAQVQALADRHDGAAGTVIPSLYLALAPWPAVIAGLPDVLVALYDPATLRAARAATVARAQTAALALLPDPPPPPGAVAQMRPALTRFTTLLIPDMVPVCLALRRAMAEADQPG